MPENQVTDDPKVYSRTDVIAIVNEAMNLNGFKTLPTVKEKPQPGTDLQITEVKYENGELLLSIYSPHANINPYAVKIEQQDNGFVVRNAREVPHTSGDEPLRITTRLPIGKKVGIGLQSEKNPEYYAFEEFTRVEQTDEAPEQGTDPQPSTPVEVVVPPVKKDGFVYPRFGVNTTGYGFSPEADGSLNPEWWERIGWFQKAGAVDYVRIHLTWQDWEPVKAQFAEIELLQAVKRLKKMGLDVAFCSRPYRNDDRIAQHERAADQNGELFHVGPENLPGGYHTFSLGGVNAQAEFKNSMVALAKFCKSHCPDAVNTSMGYGATEEFFLPLNFSDLGQQKEQMTGVCF